MKYCITCRFYRSDWGSSCTHPDFAVWDDVYGTTYEIPSKVVKRCQHTRWERHPTMWEKLNSLLLPKPTTEERL